LYSSRNGYRLHLHKSTHLIPPFDWSNTIQGGMSVCERELSIWMTNWLIGISFSSWWNRRWVNVDWSHFLSKSDIFRRLLFIWQRTTMKTLTRLSCCCVTVRTSICQMWVFPFTLPLYWDRDITLWHHMDANAGWSKSVMWIYLCYDLMSFLSSEFTFLSESELLLLSDSWEGHLNPNNNIHLNPNLLGGWFHDFLEIHFLKLLTDASSLLYSLWPDWISESTLASRSGQIGQKCLFFLNEWTVWQPSIHTIYLMPQQSLYLFSSLFYDHTFFWYTPSTYLVWGDVKSYIPGIFFSKSFCHMDIRS
jgi:hypothetical protein